MIWSPYRIKLTLFRKTAGNKHQLEPYPTKPTAIQNLKPLEEYYHLAFEHQIVGFSLFEY